MVSFESQNHDANPVRPAEFGFTWIAELTRGSHPVADCQTWVADGGGGGGCAFEDPLGPGAQVTATVPRTAPSGETRTY